MGAAPGGFAGTATAKTWIILFAALLFIALLFYALHPLLALVPLFTVIFSARCFYDASSRGEGLLLSGAGTMLLVLGIAYTASRARSPSYGGNGVADFTGPMLFFVILGWLGCCLVVAWIDARPVESRAEDDDLDTTFSELRQRRQELPATERDYRRALNALSGQHGALEGRRRKACEWLRVVIARKEGSLTAWEGIRLVREYV